MRIKSRFIDMSFVKENIFLNNVPFQDLKITISPDNRPVLQWINKKQALRLGKFLIKWSKS